MSPRPPTESRPSVTPISSTRPRFPLRCPSASPGARTTHLPTTYSHAIRAQRPARRSANGTTLEVGYNGSQSRHLDNLLNADQRHSHADWANRSHACPIRSSGASGIQWLNADGIGNYNGLGVKFSQRFGANLTTLLSYTWSKSLDDSSDIRGPGNDFSPPRMRAAPFLRKRPLGLQHSAAIRRLRPLLAAIRQGPALSQPRRHRKPGGGRLAGKHHHHAAERLA